MEWNEFIYLSSLMARRWKALKFNLSSIIFSTRFLNNRRMLRINVAISVYFFIFVILFSRWSVYSSGEWIKWKRVFVFLFFTPNVNIFHSPNFFTTAVSSFTLLHLISLHSLDSFFFFLRNRFCKYLRSFCVHRSYKYVWQREMGSEK